MPVWHGMALSSYFRLSRNKSHPTSLEPCIRGLHTSFDMAPLYLDLLDSIVPVG